ncbi:MAG: ABC transporter permease [Kineosporiaceae bacterium]|nr:ABC transporter permease [Aeromicrobium sp.]
MNRLIPAWRASLRLAVRSITRAKGRSTLVALMVGAPVALAVVLATLFLTQDISPNENIPARMGSTQAVARFLGGEVGQDGNAINFSWAGNELAASESDAAALKLAKLTDASIISLTRGFVTLESHPLTGVDVIESDFTRPGTDGIIGLKQGRVPSAADEVVISQNLNEDGTLGLGSSITTEGGVKLKVVGIGDIGSIVPDPGSAVIAVLPSSSIPMSRRTSEFLIDRLAPVTWEQVQGLNKAGFFVESRAVINDPPRDATQSAQGSNEGVAVVRIVIAAIMIEVILLAGPAFAVGVRRQRRELALIAAAGGSPRDIRRVVIAQALVLGLAASVVGAAVGVVISRLIFAGNSQLFGMSFGPFEWSLPLALLAILLGSMAAAIAAYAPARQVSREPLTTVLAGRRIEAGGRAGWPIFGFVVVIIGLLLTFNGARPENSDTGIATGAIFVVVGVVFIIPALIRFVARLAPALPLPLRLALRDTARHTSRSAPAIAAVMAAVAGIVALGVGSTSDEQQRREDYAFSRPVNTAVINVGSDYDAVKSKVSAMFPSRTLAPLLTDAQARIRIEKPDCSDEEGCEWFPMIDFGNGSSGSADVSSSVVAADALTLKAWGVILTSAQSEALKAGKGLVPGINETGPGQTLNLRVVDNNGEAIKAAAQTIGVVKADLGMGPVPAGTRPILANLIVSPETAKAFALPLTAQQVLISGTVSAAEVKLLSTVIKGNGQSLIDPSSQLDVERGYHNDDSFIVILLAVVGGVAVLIGTLSATGLALNDARPDFATLNAIGATPSTRRVMAAAQALTIGVLGVAMGLIIGLLPGILAARSLTRDETGGSIVQLPWMLFAILAIVVPLLAAGASGLFIRNNTVTARRLAD